MGSLGARWQELQQMLRARMLTVGEEGRVELVNEAVLTEACVCVCARVHSYG